VSRAVVGEGETTVDRDMHAVSSPGHDGRKKKKKKKKGRHDELGYHLKCSKGIGCSGRECVYMIGFLGGSQ